MNQQERDEVVTELSVATGLRCYYDNGDFVLFRKRESGIYRQLIIKEKSPWVLAYGSKYAQARILMNEMLLSGFSSGDSVEIDDSVPKNDEAVWCRIKYNCKGSWFAIRDRIIAGASSLYQKMQEVGVLGPVEEFLRVTEGVDVSSLSAGEDSIARSSSAVDNEELVDNVLAPEGYPFPADRRAAVITVEKLLLMNLRIPEYQRPYKWTRRNVEELMQDIADSVKTSDDSAPPLKYRLGTVILHASDQDGKFDVVDGQQRILTLLLINRLLNEIRKNKVNPPLLEDDVTMKFLSRNRISRKNLHENYAVVKSCLAKNYELRRKLVVAFNDTLEMVAIKVDELSEAFQLFDSQNTRGRALDPHDLLKAFHLRAMAQKAKANADDAEDDEMKEVVTEWESQSEASLRSLFDNWLFRICNWSRKRRTHQFCAADIHEFKGVPFDSDYSFALRAKAAMPRDNGAECRRFQIGEDFEEGREFFRMVSHYLRMVERAKSDDYFKDRPEIKDVLRLADGKGFSHVENMFRCALLCFVDRFGEDALSDHRIIDKLCLWAFVLRLDMNHVSEDSVNKYAVTESGTDYTNAIPMFSVIKTARTPSDIAIQDVCGVTGCRFKRKQGLKNREELVKALKNVEA
ncbi:MAG: DUF262 domain-containing protein [Kiritimatiellae bacterium]|nr:DUF262 domain-containing protein [Kiritimatiellia bacterium]